MKNLIIMAALLGFVFGCTGKHSRTVGGNATSEQVFAKLQDLIGGTNLTDIQVVNAPSDKDQHVIDANQLRLAAGTTVYHSNGSGQFGPMKSVLAFPKLREIGINASLSEITRVEIFFLDNEKITPRNALVLAYQKEKETGMTVVVYTADQAPLISKDKYQVVLQSSPINKIFATSGDVEGGTHLQGAIQLLIHGSDRKILGKFSNLLGFQQ